MLVPVIVLVFVEIKISMYLAIVKCSYDNILVKIHFDHLWYQQSS